MVKKLVIKINEGIELEYSGGEFLMQFMSTRYQEEISLSSRNKDLKFNLKKEYDKITSVLDELDTNTIEEVVYTIKGIDVVSYKDVGVNYHYKDNTNEEILRFFSEKRGS